MDQQYQNKLYYGDNLTILQDHIASESIDLIYLDPPFNSKRDYNLLFKTPKGHESDAQITAFEDTWHWGEQAEREFTGLFKQANTAVAEMINSLRRFLKESDMMAYLVMMANRLLEMHRVLKPTGSLYLHCDPTSSHYLKIVLDTIFCAENFRNELIWKRATSGSSKAVAQRFGSDHDVILYFSKNSNVMFNKIYLPYPAYEIEKRFKRSDDHGRYKDAELATYSADTLEKLKAEGKLIINPSGKYRYKIYLDEIKGVLADDVWTDIFPINSQAQERLGYPTQKPLALLERIIQASSNPGDIVMDPFCGCGTAVHAAQKLNRRWIGIDITHLAISLIEKRMKDAFSNISFEVHGTPRDFDGAKNLAERDKYQFQWWACSLVNAQPYQGKKKGADSGIDGLVFFQDTANEAKKVIVSVKGGTHVNVTMVKDLIATVEREKAAIGLFITLAEPTRPMTKEAVSAGFYHSEGWNKDFPKIQILTVENLMSGASAQLPPANITFKKAEKNLTEGGKQKIIEF